MSIPLSRLYDHLYHKSNHDMLIYGWPVHGSRKLDGLVPLNSLIQGWVKEMSTPILIMHDQEPLNFNQWSNEEFAQHWTHTIIKHNFNDCHKHPDRVAYQVSLHLRGIAGPASNLYDKLILVHSEQQSDQVEIYKRHDYIPVYYWSHALIAADWFRYAAHDPELNYRTDQFDRDFLIYNRAWSGTREYRLKFAELMVSTGLEQSSMFKFSATDDGKHYTEHQFVNPALSIQHLTLDQQLETNTHPSSASADYYSYDYSRSGIEIVLETLFDDSRWHLTEKTLRPIACGKPFMLAATAGSLQYLRNYGFETFGKYINEEYDTIADPVDRLHAIITEMQRIRMLPHTEKQALWKSLHEISARNKQRFFSEAWQTEVEQEFYNNLDAAVLEINQHCTGKYWAKSKSMPSSAGSRDRPAEQIQALHQWLAARNQALTRDPSHSASGGFCL